MAAGLLRDGETLIPLRRRVADQRASLRAGGVIELNGKTYTSLSSAAQALSKTTSEPGWEFWAVLRGSEHVRLYDVRAEFLAGRRHVRAPSDAATDAMRNGEGDSSQE